MSWSGYIPGDLLNAAGFTPDKLVRTDELALDYDRMRSKYENVQPRGDLLWVAIDLDGTLAEGIWTPDNPTSEIGDPIWENVRKAREVEAFGYKIVIHTARSWTDYENIEAWCHHYNVPFRRIVCGKVLAALYIDDRNLDMNAESWVPEREDRE